MANTDHRGVYLKVQNSPFIRGPGYWHFNIALLKDPTFVEGINQLVDEVVNDPYYTDEETR